MIINGNLVAIYVSYIQGAVGALLPLIATVIGVFITFAIANSLRFFILRLVKK